MAAPGINAKSAVRLMAWMIEDGLAAVETQQRPAFVRSFYSVLRKATIGRASATAHLRYDVGAFETRCRSTAAGLLSISKPRER